MLKKILKLEGAQQLSKNEQRTVNGAGPNNRCCDPEMACCYPSGLSCRFVYSTNDICV